MWVNTVDQPLMRGKHFSLDIDWLSLPGNILACLPRISPKEWQRRDARVSNHWVNPTFEASPRRTSPSVAFGINNLRFFSHTDCKISAKSPHLHCIPGISAVSPLIRAAPACTQLLFFCYTSNHCSSFWLVHLPVAHNQGNRGSAPAAMMIPLTHMATQSWPMVSCLSYLIASINLVPTICTWDQTGLWQFVFERSNIPPKPP